MITMCYKIHVNVTYTSRLATKYLYPTTVGEKNVSSQSQMKYVIITIFLIT